MTFHKRFDLSGSSGLPSSTLQLISMQLSDATLATPKKHRKTMRIYHTSRINIADFDYGPSDKVKNTPSDTDPSTTKTASNTTTSTTTSTDSIADKAPCHKVTQSKSLSRATSAKYAMALSMGGSEDSDGGWKEDREEEDKMQRLTRGVVVSRSGRFREKLKMRSRRLFSLDGASLLQVDDKVVKKQNEEHIKNLATDVRLSQKEFSFLNDEDNSTGAVLSVMPSQDFHGPL